MRNSPGPWYTLTVRFIPGNPRGPDRGTLIEAVYQRDPVLRMGLMADCQTQDSVRWPLVIIGTLVRGPCLSDGS